MGGTIRKDFSTKVTHLIAHSTHGEKYRVRGPLLAFVSNPNIGSGGLRAGDELFFDLLSSSLLELSLRAALTLPFFSPPPSWQCAWGRPSSPRPGFTEPGRREKTCKIKASAGGGPPKRVTALALSLPQTLPRRSGGLPGRVQGASFPGLRPQLFRLLRRREGQHGREDSQAR